jgi:cellobiose-specific phosphotransferase system component IIB
MPFVPIKKQIDKIYQKIDKIAKKGQDNFQEYYDYVDDVILKGNYALYTQALYIKYDFDYSKYFSTDIIKEKSWPLILIKTNSKFQDDLHQLFDDNDIYQIGPKIYYGTSSTYLGSIREDDVYISSIDGLGYTDPEFQTIIENRTILLTVEKVGVTISSTFSTWNFDYTFDKNLLNLYKEAISYLI